MALHVLRTGEKRWVIAKQDVPRQQGNLKKAHAAIIAARKGKRG